MYRNSVGEGQLRVNIERLEELLTASAASDFAVADRTESNQMLRTEPHARAFAVRFLATDALLADALEVSASEQQFGVAVDLHDGRTGLGLDQSTDAGVQISTRFSRWHVIAIPIVALAFVAVFVVVSGRLQLESGQNASGLVSDGRGGDSACVAFVQNAQGHSDLTAGIGLESGRHVTLSRGRVTFAFQSGAILAVQAPAELTVSGPNSARLQRGLVTVRVPGPIKGFVLETPAGRLVDLGTSFGVEVDANHRASVAVFEGKIEIGEQNPQRLLAGNAMRVADSRSELDRKTIDYNVESFMNTWGSSFGIDGLHDDVRFARPGERESPERVINSDSLLLIPESGGVQIPSGSELSIVNPGTHAGPFPRKNPPRRDAILTRSTVVDSYLLQYNRSRPSPTSKDRRSTTEVRIGRPVVGIIARKVLLTEHDPRLAHPDVDFVGLVNRGLYKNDQVTLSSDRRTIQFTFDI